MLSVEMVPVALWVLGTLLLWAPHLGGHRAHGAAHSFKLTALLAVTVSANSGPLAFGTAAIAAMLHAHAARDATRTAALSFALSAVATIVAAVALWLGADLAAFVASSVAIALRVGLIPLHTGAVRLCARAPALQSQQLATVIGLVVAHLRFTDHTPIAFEIAPLFVRYGAVMTLVPALMALVQRDLQGFLRMATVMHGGMLFAALGAAGRGHAAAAVMVVITTAAAMGGLGLMVAALEDRVGTVSFLGPGGRVQTFPRLAAAFLLFAGAGVALPGTAGFIADDLMLHALWEESVMSTVLMILGSALLAVASLMTYSRVFLGRAVPSLAADLAARERAVVVVLVLLLVGLGIMPGLLLTPADEFLRPIAAAATGL